MTDREILDQLEAWLVEMFGLYRNMTDYNDQRQRVRSFAKLEENWDSYGASPISAEASIKALETLDRLEVIGFPPPYVYPTTWGGVTIEFQHPLDELDITEKGEIIFGDTEQ